MKLSIDTHTRTLTLECGQKLPLYSPEAFKIISDLWLKIGWNERYHYTFTWMGTPILQLPEDLVRLQEVIWTLKPDFIVETGIALGGSLLFYASLFEAMGHGHVIGIDIDLRPQNRDRLEKHSLYHRISLVDGSSTDPQVASRVKSLIGEGRSVIVILDSNHSKEHVAKELEIYSELVNRNSYLIVADGFKRELCDVPRGKADWIWDNPATAVCEFLEKHSGFVLDSPERHYNRSHVRENITHFLDAWLKKI